VKINIRVNENIDKETPISINLQGEDLTFVATSNSLFFRLDEDLADKLAFQINALLQEIERKKIDKKA
jgi:hypothetical protein